MITLVSVGRAELDEPAARSYARCLKAGAPDSVESSFRDPATQQALRDRFLAGTFPAFVAPVDKSDHCKGRAIDLRGGEAKAWFRANGGERGWIFTDATEDWHIAYREQHDVHVDDPIEEDDMFTDADREQLARVEKLLQEQPTRLATVVSRESTKVVNAALKGLRSQIAAILKKVGA